MTRATTPSSASPPTAASRFVSALELALGATLVIGHNVLRVLPNEVPILAVLGLLSVRLRNGGWAAMGLSRPASWGRVVAIALAAAALRIVLGSLAVEPLAERVWPPAAAPEGMGSLAGNVGQALMWLGISWTFAAFGEEIVYRGYLLTRAAESLGGTKLAYMCGAVGTAVLFGFGHFYKGPAGIVDSGMAGLVLGAAYLVAGRNLWASILAHGFIDTFAIGAEFLGWDS